MNMPKNYSIRPDIVIDDLVIIAVPLPELMFLPQVRELEQFSTACELLQEEMEQREWVEGGVPYQQSRALMPIHVDTIIDYSRDGGLPCLYLAAIGRNTDAIFIPNQSNP